MCLFYVCWGLFSAFPACVPGTVQCVYGMCAGDCSVCGYYSEISMQNKDQSIY